MNKPLVVVVATFQLTMLACAKNANAGGAPQKAIASYSAPQQGRATLTLKPIHPAFFADEPVILNATVKNISNSPMSVLITGPADAYAITVVRHPGHETRKSLYYNALTAQHGTHSIRIQPLKPGEQYTERINLSRLYDLTLAGEYQVHLAWKVSFAEDASTVDRLSANTPFVVRDDNQPIMEHN